MADYENLPLRLQKQYKMDAAKAVAYREKVRSEQKAIAEENKRILAEREKREIAKALAAIENVSNSGNGSLWSFSISFGHESRQARFTSQFFENANVGDRGGSGAWTQGIANFFGEGVSIKAGKVDLKINALGGSIKGFWPGEQGMER